MGLRPEFENVRSSIQHRVRPPDIERVIADVRSGGYSTCFPLLGWVLGVDLRLLRVLQINPVLAASGHRPYGLQSGSFAGPSSQRDMSKMLLLQEARSHDCRLSQAAECKLSSTVRHSSSSCSPWIFFPAWKKNASIHFSPLVEDHAGGLLEGSWEGP